MGDLIRFSVSLDKKLVGDFDKKIKLEKYPTRSKAISDLINNYLLEKRKIEGNCVAGAISLVYNHHKRMISEVLTGIQHDYHHLIISSQHIHLDSDNCFELVVVKGKPKQIEDLFYALKRVKGIQNAYLTIAGYASICVHRH